MESSLLLAAVAAVAYGLLRKLKAANLRAAVAVPPAPCRAAIAEAASEGLLALGLGALGLGAVCRWTPTPAAPAILALALSLAALCRRNTPAAVLSAELLSSSAAAAAAAWTLSEGSDDARAYLLALTAAGALASVAGAALTDWAARKSGGDPFAPALGSWTAALLLTLAALPLSWLLEEGLPCFGAAVCGVLAGLFATRLAARNGPWRIVLGLVPAITALGAWCLCGNLGIALAAAGMTVGAAPLSAGEALSLPPTSPVGKLSAGELPGLGGTLSPAGRGFATAAAALSALALMAACFRAVGFDTGSLQIPLAAGLVIAAAVTAKGGPWGSALTAAARLFFGAALAAALVLRG